MQLTRMIVNMAMASAVSARLARLKKQQPLQQLPAPTAHSGAAAARVRPLQRSCPQQRAAAAVAAVAVQPVPCCYSLAALTGLQP